MRTFCAVLLLSLAAGCTECGWGNCCGGSCPLTGTGSQYTAQSQTSTSTARPQTSVANNQPSQQATSVASSKPERQVEYYDGKQPATYLR